MPRLTIEELLSKIEYLTIDDVNNTKWKLEDMNKIHPSLDAENHLTFVLYLALRNDLSEEETEQCLTAIHELVDSEKELIQKQYSHFEESSY